MERGDISVSQNFVLSEMMLPVDHAYGYSYSNMLLKPMPLQDIRVSTIRFRVPAHSASVPDEYNPMIQCPTAYNQARVPSKQQVELQLVC